MNRATLKLAGLGLLLLALTIGALRLDLPDATTADWSRRIDTTESRLMKGRIWSSTRATACMRWLGSMTMRRTSPARVRRPCGWMRTER